MTELDNVLYLYSKSARLKYKKAINKAFSLFNKKNNNQNKKSDSSKILILKK